MTILSLEDKHTKDLMKQALLELFEERRDLFYELFEELFEDKGLANAMREGREQRYCQRKGSDEGSGGITWNSDFATVFSKM